MRVRRPGYCELPVCCSALCRKQPGVQPVPIAKLKQVFCILWCEGDTYCSCFRNKQMKQAPC